MGNYDSDAGTIVNCEFPSFEHILNNSRAIPIGCRPLEAPILYHKFCRGKIGRGLR